MFLNGKNKMLLHGASLTECAISMAILGVICVGSLSYRYHSMLNARMAKADIAATELGQLILEDWKSTGGKSDYVPQSPSLCFVNLGETEHSYMTVIDTLPMAIALSYSDVSSDSTTGIVLRKLKVVIDWNRTNQNTSSNSKPTLSLTSYVRRDSSGG